MKKLNVVVLYGGISSEREISLKTGAAVFNALSQNKEFIVTLVDLKKNDFVKQILSLKNEKVDIVFLALHGRFGEDGGIQALLDALGIKYTGADAISSAIAMNKHFTKNVLLANKIPTPKWFIVNKKEKYLAKKLFIKSGINFPVIIKPCSEGSAIGVAIANNFSAYIKGLNTAFQYDDVAVVEKFVEGKEISVPILGGKVLPLIEIRPNLNKFYDYSSKYEPGGSTHIIPAKIGKNIYKKISELALKSVKCIGCTIMARVDFMLDKNNKPYVLEINTIPGMTSTSLFPESAKFHGISFKQLVKKIVMLSLKKG